MRCCCGGQIIKVSVRGVTFSVRCKSGIGLHILRHSSSGKVMGEKGEKKKKSPRSQQVMKTSPFLSQTQPWYNLTMLVKLKTRLFNAQRCESD